jgi:hypothetical protein
MKASAQLLYHCIRQGKAHAARVAALAKHMQVREAKASRHVTTTPLLREASVIIPYMQAFPGEPLALVVSMAEDKNHKGILAALRGAAPKAIIFTSAAIAGAQTRCARPAGLTGPAVFMLTCVEFTILMVVRGAGPKAVLTSVAIAGAQASLQV